MKIRVTFDLSPYEQVRLKALIGKKKGLSYEDYRKALKEIVRKKLLGID